MTDRLRVNDSCQWNALSVIHSVNDLYTKPPTVIIKRGTIIHVQHVCWCKLWYYAKYKHRGQDGILILYGDPHTLSNVDTIKVLWSWYYVDSAMLQIHSIKIVSFWYSCRWCYTTNSISIKMVSSWYYTNGVKCISNWDVVTLIRCKYLCSLPTDMNMFLTLYNGYEFDNVQGIIQNLIKY